MLDTREEGEHADKQMINFTERRWKENHLESNTSQENNLLDKESVRRGNLKPALLRNGDDVKNLERRRIYLLDDQRMKTKYWEFKWETEDA